MILQYLICLFTRLYKSVGEYDVLLGIFGGKIGTQAITRHAMEAESRGDYQTARKLYDEVSGSTDDKRNFQKL